MHQLCGLRGPSGGIPYAALPALMLEARGGLRSRSRKAHRWWFIRRVGMEASAAPRAGTSGGGESAGRGEAPPSGAAAGGGGGSDGIMDVLKVAAADLGDPKSVAVVAADRSHTYGQLLQSARAVAARLKEKDAAAAPAAVASAGLVGQRVGIMAKPCAEFVAGLWGTWMSGGVAVPLALSHPAAELAHVLADAEVAVVVATDEFRDVVEPLAAAATCAGARFLPLPPVPHLQQQPEPPAGGARAEEDEDARAAVAAQQQQSAAAALIIYTSGTTGKPKGVVHTHAGLAAQARTLAQAWAYSPRDRVLHCLPLHHVHGLVNALLAPLHAGATVEFLPKFSTRGVWQRWRRPDSSDAITVFTGVPTMYVRLLQGYDAMAGAEQAACAAAARRVRLMMCGSSALPVPVLERWERVTGHRLLERYGMTEFGMAAANPLHGERRPGFVGRALPGVELKVLVDEADGEGDLEGDDGDNNNDNNKSKDSGWRSGELCVRSPSMFREYWRQARVTRDSFTPDGFFRTGDSVAVAPDGYVKVLGRTSVDIVKSGGYKLSALEIEGVLLEHPAVRECAVLGVPDADYGELVTAIVVPRAEPPISLVELRAWAAPKLAAYKMPQRLVVWPELPRNAMGKVNKKQLLAKLLAPR